jgi:inosine/xanthosine triphosphatase
MKTILVASHNPVKIQAALAGFQRMFPDEQFLAEGVSVSSGVSHQPLTRAETLQGARNRAAGAHRLHPGADYCVGIEGGVEDGAEGLEGFAWVVILSGGREGKGCTGTFYLPPPVAELVRAGKELGEADDIVFGRTNSKQENGAVGILSGDVIDRSSFYTEAVILALFPFKNPQLYPR